MSMLYSDYNVVNVPHSMYLHNYFVHCNIKEIKLITKHFFLIESPRKSRPGKVVFSFVRLVVMLGQSFCLTDTFLVHLCKASLGMVMVMLLFNISWSVLSTFV
jgi:hypothetical protein